MDLPDKYKSLDHYQINKKGVPRTPREEEIERAAKLLGYSFERICGMTRHFPHHDEEAFVKRMRFLMADALEGKNPAALWQYLLKTKYAKQTRV
jgi:hypothetical protein